MSSSPVDRINDLLSRLGFRLVAEYEREDLALEETESCFEGRFIASCSCMADLDVVVADVPENSIIAIAIELSYVQAVEPEPILKFCKATVELLAESQVGRKPVYRYAADVCPEQMV